jgi:hypothetical protein
VVVRVVIPVEHSQTLPKASSRARQDTKQRAPSGRLTAGHRPRRLAMHPAAAPRDQEKRQGSTTARCSSSAQARHRMHIQISLRKGDLNAYLVVAAGRSLDAGPTHLARDTISCDLPVPISSPLTIWPQHCLISRQGKHPVTRPSRPASSADRASSATVAAATAAS